MKTKIVGPGWRFGALAILFVFGFINVGSTDARSAKPETYSVLFTFDGFSDGAQPEGALIHDAAGNLYGTTQNYGVVFKLDPAGNQTILHTFLTMGKTAMVLSERWSGTPPVTSTAQLPSAVAAADAFGIKAVASCFV